MSIDEDEFLGSDFPDESVPVFEGGKLLELGDLEERLASHLSNQPIPIYSFRPDDHMSMAEAVLRRLARKHGDGRQPVVMDEGLFWVYGGGYWKKLHPNDIKREIGHINSWAKPEGRKEMFSVSEGMVRSVYGLARIEADSIGRFGDSNVAPGICFRNGFVQVSETGVELQTHSPDHNQRHRHHIDYSADSECPTWLKFLEDVFHHDSDKEEKKRFLAQFVGACLTGQAAVHNRAVMLIGQGANGKSVFCDVVENLFPRDAVSGLPPHAMASPGRVHVLAGALLNIVTDIPTRELKDAGGFKQIVSGDPVEGRRLYENSFRFRPQAGHLFSANDLPLSADHSHGFYRRWCVLSFNRRFDRDSEIQPIPRDQLVESLLAEKPGIMRWALDGAVDLMRRKGLFIPSSHERNIEGWRSSSNQVASFIQDCVIRQYRPCRETPGMKSSMVYQQYLGWAEMVGRKRMSLTEFSKRLANMDVPHRQMSDGRWFGVDLRSLSTLVSLNDMSSGANETPEDDKEAEIG